ncbi:MAG: hypothetical protein ACK44B_04265, partial [Flavobacteriales bacterium]
MAGNTPTIGTGVWTVVSGSATITTPTSSSTLVTVSAGNTATLQWTISNGACASSSDQVVLVNNALSTTSNAGADQSNCNVSTFTLAGNNPTSGTGVWTITSGSATITNSTLFNTTVTGVAAGSSVTLSWTITNGTCSSSTDQVILTNYQLPTTSNAGIDKFNCNSGTFNMTGNTPSVGTGLWSVVSGTATITTPSSPGTSVTAVPAGTTATLRWTITNGTCAVSTDEVVLTNYATPTVANAGADQNNCDNTSFTLAGNNPSTGTGVWTVTSGTATVTTPSQFNSGVTGVPVGTSATLTWTISNGTCTASADQVILTNSTVPSTAAAGPDQNICGTSVVMAGNTAVSGTGTWTLVSGPNSPNIVSPNAANTSIGGLASGVYVFQWSINNPGCVASTDQVSVTVTTSALTANANVDQSQCGSGSFTLSGSISGGGNVNWSVVSGTATITTLNSLTSTVT